MLVTVEGTYKDGKVELEETPQGIEQSRVFVTFVSQPAPRRPVSLLGKWKGSFPDDFDVDAALREIRSDSNRKLDELSNG